MLASVSARSRGSPLTITTIEIANPAFGLWQLRVDGDIEYEAKRINIEIPNEYENELRVASRLVYHPENGLTRVIEASLEGLEDGIRPALSEIHVPAMCLAGRQEERLTFRDDGRDWDRRAGDGIFTHENVGMTNSLFDSDEYCQLKVMMLGKADGHPFTRQAVGRVDFLSCRDPKLKAGQAYELKNRFNSIGALRFFVHEITPQGEVLTSKDDGYRVPLDLEVAMCMGATIRRYDGELPQAMTAPLENHRLAVQGRIIGSSGEPIEADVEVWWTPDGHDTNHQKSASISEFEIERAGQGMTVLFSKEGYLPVCLGLSKGRDHVCTELEVVLTQERRDSPRTAASRDPEQTPCDLKTLSIDLDSNIRDRFCGMPHRLNTFRIER